METYAISKFKCTPPLTVEDYPILSKSERLQSANEKKQNMAGELEHSYAKQSKDTLSYATRSKVDLSAGKTTSEISESRQKEIGIVTFVSDVQTETKNVGAQVTKGKKKGKSESLKEVNVVQNIMVKSEVPKCKGEKRKAGDVPESQALNVPQRKKPKLVANVTGKDPSSHKVKESNESILVVDVENKGHQSTLTVPHKVKKSMPVKEHKSKVPAKVLSKSSAQKMKISSSIFAKKVSQKYNVKSDQLQEVSPVKEHFCGLCEIQFGTIHLYSKHMKCKHPKEEQPKEINVIDTYDKYVEVEELHAEDEILPHKCVKCKKQFANQSDLNNI